MAVEVKELFPIHTQKESVRLFFAKESAFSSVWHICDAALGKEISGGLYYGALHGAFMRTEVRADSVLQADILRKDSDQFCTSCLEEYELAKDTIKERRLMKFE